MLCIEFLCCLDALDIALRLYLHVFKCCPQLSKWQSVAQIAYLGKKMHLTSLCGKKSVYQQPLNFVVLTVDGL